MSAPRLDELRMQAQHARQRYDLYKAKAYGPRPTSAARMRELERECARAEASLRFAEGEAKRAAADPHQATGSSSNTERAPSVRTAEDNARDRQR